MRLQEIDKWARRNHGLITFAASGVSKRTWYREIRRGVLEQVHPGVARIPGTARTYEQRVAAAVLAAAPNALASHRSAAHLWDLAPIPSGATSPVDILLPDRHRNPSLVGVIIHRPADFQRLNPQTRHNIRCTNPLRALLDLGAVDATAVHEAVGRALSKRLVTLAALQATVIEHSRHGRAGIVALRHALDDWSIDAKPADSVLELAFNDLVRRFGLPPLEFHPIIEGWEIDFRVAGTAILIECDGWTTHGLQKSQFERDRRRDQDLTAAGWIVQRLTYRAVTQRRAETARRIRRLAERWGHLTPPNAA